MDVTEHADTPAGRLTGRYVSLDRDARDRALTAAAEALIEVGRTLRLRAPRARILFIDYFTLLPPAGFEAPPLSKSDADLGRHVAETLERHTAEAAAATGCEIVRAGEASRAHHAWSREPWTTKGAVPIPGRPFPFHPTAAGMHAVAALVAAQVCPSLCHREAGVLPLAGTGRLLLVGNGNGRHRWRQKAP